MYRVFTRTFWKPNPSWPGGREPHLGRRSYIAHGLSTYEEAREIAKDYNRTHEPGRLSRKAEVEES